LRSAGYDISWSNNVNKQTKDKFTRIIVQVPDLSNINAPLVDVYCTKEQAQSHIDRGQLNGSKTAYQVAGPALYYILAVPKLNMKTNEFERLPPLQPIIRTLVAAGSPNA
jgi:hypothetical protein